MYYRFPILHVPSPKVTESNKKTIEDESQQGNDKHSGTEETSSQSSIVDEESDE